MEPISAEEAWRQIEQALPEGIAAHVPLLEAIGCELAEDLAAAFDQPPFPRSPLDGYAVRSEDLRGADPGHPVYLTVIGQVMAGDAAAFAVGPGQAVRIMTGAPIPKGADCVVRQEDTDYGELRAAFYVEEHAFQNYCFRGEDFKRGDCLLQKGIRFGAVEAGVAASMGYDRVLVYRKPRIAVLSCGDELTEPGQALLPGKIYNANQYLVSARLLELGISPVYSEMMKDDEIAVGERIREMSEEVDLIITTGGVSVGKKDIMHEALQRIGAERLFWRIRIKPGMPTLCSRYRDTLIISLSGNPFGAAANMEILVRPALARLGRRPEWFPVRVKAVMADSYPKKTGVRRLVRAVYRGGRVYLPRGSHSSGVLGSMAGCNCLADMPAGTDGLAAGDAVEVILF